VKWVHARVVATVAAVAFVALAPAATFADDVPVKNALVPISYSHEGQAMVSARFGLGLRAIVPYEDTTFCGETSTQTSTGFAAACTGRAPFSLDFEVGYGISDRIDLVLELRIGLEPDFDATPTGDDGPHPLHLAPGARFFWGEDEKTKVFTTAQLVLDVAGYASRDGAELGTDVGVKNLSGLWFDLDRAYGFYIYAGPTATFARWLRFELEGGFGIQGRYR
jgi:hypothetical protein